MLRVPAGIRIHPTAGEYREVEGGCKKSGGENV
jgi:hypothetical protein